METPGASNQEQRAQRGGGLPHQEFALAQKAAGGDGNSPQQQHPGTEPQRPEQGRDLALQSPSARMKKGHRRQRQGWNPQPDGEDSAHAADPGDAHAFHVDGLQHPGQQQRQEGID